MLISDEYRRLNHELHQRREDYGSGGGRHAEDVRKLLNSDRITDVLDYGCGKGSLSRSVAARNYDPAVPEFSADPEPADLTVCTDVLEHIEPECLDRVLGHLRDCTRVRSYVVVNTQEDRTKTLPDGRNPHLIQRDQDWWLERLARFFWVDKASTNKHHAVFHLRPRWDEVTVCLWKWRGVREYTAEHVNVMARMVERHLPMPHRTICFTDDPDGITECETFDLWDDPEVEVEPGRLNCYRRLKMFAIDIPFKRMLSLDLDGVITGDLTPIVDTPEPFKIWGRKGWSCPYNGGHWLLTAGARREIWDDLDPQKVRRMTKRARILGSDQAWIYHRLGPKEATWGEADGVWRYKPAAERDLPKDARIVWFPGETKPWADSVAGWVREHWR